MHIAKFHILAIKISNNTINTINNVMTRITSTSYFTIIIIKCLTFILIEIIHI